MDLHPFRADEKECVQVEPELLGSAKTLGSREQGKSLLVHKSLWWKKIPDCLLNGLGDQSNPQAQPQLGE